MSVTTLEFEKYLIGILDDMGSRKRCEWCGSADDQRRIGPRSKLCNRCKEWKRKESLAKEWKHKNPIRRDEEAFHNEYVIQFTDDLRNGGGTRPWQGFVSALQLEWALADLTKHLFGEDRPCCTTLEFAQFSDAQRQLLMYMFDQMTKIWLQRHRRNFAIQQALEAVSRTFGSQE